MQPTAPTRPMTVEEFEAYASHPDNAERRLEFINDEIVELVSTRKSSRIAGTLMIALGIFLRANPLGELTGADGGYKVGKDRVMPDVGFVATARLVPNSDEQVWYNFAPDLAVEVLSPTDKPHAVRRKISNYLAAGTIVWLVDPDTETVEVHAPGQPVQVLKVGGTLTGGTVLPGFSLALSEVFA